MTGLRMVRTISHVAVRLAVRHGGGGDPTDRAAPRGFYLAIRRSSALRSRASLPNPRHSAKSCEPRSIQSLRPPLRQSAHEEIIATQSWGHWMRREIVGPSQSSRIRTVRISAGGGTAEML